jgi:hypothetical protein
VFSFRFGSLYAVLGFLIVAMMAVSACNGSPVAPGGAPLATGRWTGSGACLSVSETECELTVGCGHGRFGRPTLRSDGTFEVDGTYRIEVGPAVIEPAPAAHFSGTVTRSTFSLSVTPTNGSPPVTYSMTPAAPGACTVPCV